MIQFTIVHMPHSDSLCWLKGSRPTNDISIEFEIRPKFAMFWFQEYSTDCSTILHTSRQCDCRDMCKILLWLVTYILS